MSVTIYQSTRRPNDNRRSRRDSVALTTPRSISILCVQRWDCVLTLPDMITASPDMATSGGELGHKRRALLHHISSLLESSGGSQFPCVLNT
jgi:hypothetical protein